MQRRRTDPANAAARTRVGLTCPPVAVMGAWAVLVAGGAVWSPLAGVAGPLAAMGEMLLAVLALHALHEGGHVLAGLLMGAPLQSVTLGLFTVRRERRAGSPRRGRFGLAVNESWRRFAGCVEREVNPAPGLRAALTVTALGGPAVSVLGGALLLGAPAPWDTVGLASVVIGVLNAVPMVTLGQASDGMIVRRLWGGRPADVTWRAEVLGGEGGAAVA